jgi:F-type H+-transporting ATPase subunit epsilon
MKLTVATPLAIVVDGAAVAHLRAEDATGAFGILPGHADFLTALTISVVSWRGPEARARERHVAVRGGMLRVTGGDTIAIATREAVPGSDLAQLEHDVLARFREGQAAETAARLDAQRLYLAAIRRIIGLVRPDRARGPVPLLRRDGAGPDGGVP